MDLNDLRLKAYKAAASDPKTESTKKTRASEATRASVTPTRASEATRASVTPTRASESTRASVTPTRAKSDFVPDPQVKAAAEILTKGGLLKVPASKDDAYRRVAKFLILIGVDQAALVLKHLSQEETEKIIPEITAVRTIDPDEALAILEEFNSLIDRVKEGGGAHTAMNILEKAFGQSRAQDLMNRLNIEKENKPFEYLADKEPERILELLKDESNNARALVLSYVPPKKAAAVINMLSSQDKKEVIVNLAHTKKITPEVLARVDKVIHEKSLKQIDVKTNSIDGTGVLAEILKKMDFKSEQDIISSLRESDPSLGEDLQSRLFTTDDVLNSDDRFIQEYLRELTDVDIAYLIAGKSEDFRQKIFGNMSTGRADTILEEEQVRKPMLKKDCDKITKEFYSHLRHAWEDGKLIIHGRDDEEYV
ncbi:MAG: flagellar motor switch protein FliG [Treponema sp.]|nr:flagellar motor switch protein FliG [Treponema sp.]